MKRFLATLFLAAICIIMIADCCYADEYDIPNMTTAQLNELKEKINKELELNHEPTNDQEAGIRNAVQSYVENLYGSENVSWAWFDYSYKREWNFITMKTHADIRKKDGGKAQYDVYGEAVANSNEYTLAYLQIGTETILDRRNVYISDSRVLAMLNVKGNTSAASASQNSTLRTQHASTPTPQPIRVPSYTAQELYALYENNQISADAAVKGKTIQVSGRIDRIDTIWGTPYIYLKADDYGFTTVSCRFDKKDTDKLATLSQNDSVTIRGICDGESFLSVILDECSLVR